MNLEDGRIEHKGLRNSPQKISTEKAAALAVAAGAAILGTSVYEAGHAHHIRPAEQTEVAHAKMGSADELIYTIMKARVGSDRLNVIEAHLNDVLYKGEKTLNPDVAVQRMQKVLEAAGTLGAGLDIRDMLLEKYLEYVAYTNKHKKQDQGSSDKVASLK